MQIQLQKSEQQLRELNAQKDKFFSILAHDLKSPLIGFLSFADLMEKTFAQLSPEKRQTVIQDFRTSAEMLFALLNNLLTWARLQQGQLDVAPIRFPLDQLVARAVSLFAPNAAQKQITLTCAVSSVEVYADISMTDAIIRNLIGNALKFTPSGGIVTITAVQTDNAICVTVADSGIGISSDNLAKLFRIDSKFQNIGTAGEKGTGLGLLLCKEFVEKQGGTIWIESERGNGTQCVFTLPMQRERQEGG